MCCCRDDGTHKRAARLAHSHTGAGRGPCCLVCCHTHRGGLAALPTCRARMMQTARPRADPSFLLFFRIFLVSVGNGHGNGPRSVGC